MALKTEVQNFFGRRFNFDQNDNYADSKLDLISYLTPH